MAAHQASPFLRFSRQEHWSGLPFPSPMHESQKSKWSHSVVSDSLRPHGLQPTRLLHPWEFPGKSTGVGCHCHLRSTPPTAHKQGTWSLSPLTASAQSGGYSSPSTVSAHVGLQQPRARRTGGRTKCTNTGPRMVCLKFSELCYPEAVGNLPEI